MRFIARTAVEHCAAISPRRGIIYALLACLLILGAGFAGSTLSAGGSLAQASIHHGGDSGCDNLASAACAVPCPAGGACIASALLLKSPAPFSMGRIALTLARRADPARAPGTAPPKHPFV